MPLPFFLFICAKSAVSMPILYAYNGPKLGLKIHSSFDSALWDDQLNLFKSEFVHFISANFLSKVLIFNCLLSLQIRRGTWLQSWFKMQSNAWKTADCSYFIWCGGSAFVWAYFSEVGIVWERSSQHVYIRERSWLLPKLEPGGHH